jgi:hypothetical protein
MTLPASTPQTPPSVSGRRLAAQVVAMIVLLLTMFGGAGLGLTLFLDYLANQPYQQDHRVIVVTR